jgi:hypothetical protein
VFTKGRFGEGCLFAPLRINRLATLEHRDEGLNLAPAASISLHVVNPEGKREAVLLALEQAVDFVVGLGLRDGEVRGVTLSRLAACRRC